MPNHFHLFDPEVSGKVLMSIVFAFMFWVVHLFMVISLGRINAMDYCPGFTNMLD